MVVIMEAKPVKARFLEEILKQVEIITENYDIRPKLAVVQVEGNPASDTYVRNKMTACNNVGIESVKRVLPKNSSLGNIETVVNELNEDPSINGILVQLPIPGFKQVDNSYFSNLVIPEKDVDGFTDLNLELLLKGKPRFEPCTPKGILALLDAYNIFLEDKIIVIAGSSRIVGTPLSYMFQNRGINKVHVQNLETPDSCRSLELKHADIVVAAIGNPHYYSDPAQFKEGVVLVDVGINPGFSYKGRTIIAGDINFDMMNGIASAITPVPGGVGPMTVMMLMKNTLDAFYLQNPKFER